MASMVSIFKINIRGKLLLLLALPVAGLLFFSVTSALDRARVSVQMTDLNALASLSTKLGALAHELQKERGMTAGFLGSKGAQFANELPLQRKDTDQKQTVLDEALKDFDRSAYDVVIGQMLDKATRSLQDLASKRSAVSAQRISGTEVIGYYTDTIGSLLAVPHRTSTMSDNATVARRALTYSNLLQSKERAGIERALLSNAFAADGFTPGLLARYLANDSAQTTYLKEFLFTATPEQESFYKSKHAGQAVDEVARLKRVAGEGADGRKLGVDAGHWFSVATARIDLLKEVEDKLATGLHDTATALRGDAQRNFYLFIGIAIIGVVVALVLAFYTIRGIISSTGQLSDAVAKVAGGDYAARARVKSGDELEALSTAFDKMLDERVSSLAQKEKDSEALNNSIIEILRSVAKSAQGDLTVHAPVREDITGALSDAINSMADSTAKTLAGVAGMSHKVRSASQHGRDTVQKTSRGMSDIRGTIQETGKRIKRLGERSQEITGIVKLIDDIAERTSVLALNANMQAAMAGEAGRGFRVVADEVQRLAERSKEATDQIGKLVSTIQTETNDTMVTMDRAVGEVVKGGELADQASEEVTQLDALGEQLLESIKAFKLPEELLKETGAGETAARRAA